MDRFFEEQIYTLFLLEHNPFTYSKMHLEPDPYTTHHYLTTIDNPTLPHSSDRSLLQCPSIYLSFRLNWTYALGKTSVCHPEFLEPQLWYYRLSLILMCNA